MLHYDKQKSRYNFVRHAKHKWTTVWGKKNAELVTLDACKCVEKKKEVTVKNLFFHVLVYLKFFFFFFFHSPNIVEPSVRT